MLQYVFISSESIFSTVQFVWIDGITRNQLFWRYTEKSCNLLPLLMKVLWLSICRRHSPKKVNRTVWHSLFQLSVICKPLIFFCNKVSWCGEFHLSFSFDVSLTSLVTLRPELNSIIEALFHLDTKALDQKIKWLFFSLSTGSLSPAPAEKIHPQWVQKKVALFSFFRFPVLVRENVRKESFLSHNFFLLTSKKVTLGIVFASLHLWTTPWVYHELRSNRLTMYW